jgi:hypothetical protein
VRSELQLDCSIAGVIFYGSASHLTERRAVHSLGHDGAAHLPEHSVGRITQVISSENRVGVSIYVDGDECILTDCANVPTICTAFKFTSLEVR